MAKKIDLTGQRFGRWTVLNQSESRRAPDGRSLVYWHCVCDCGNEKDVPPSKLRNGESQSCGCYNREHQTELHRTHGKHGTRLYHIWCNMKQRCINANCELYKDYGGRGITICEEWCNSFDAFHAWAKSNGYSDELTIDRIDNGKGYSPQNCRWATMKQQGINRRSNINITFLGRTQTLMEWCDELGLPYKTIHYRIKKLGWDAEKALSTPV